VTRLRRARTDDTYAGSLAPDYPQQAPDPYSGSGRAPDPGAAPDDSEYVERPPSVMRRVGHSLAETRRRVLPLPDEVIDQFLGNGERMIHNDHPSFRSFLVQNTLLFVGLLVVAVLFLAITFNGPLVAAAFLLLILAVVLLVLVLKRLGDRYTSYVVTDTRIMRISGIISRRAHSIPWVRVTDLTIEQSLSGRLFGYATLHIESANEDSGLRDLDGVSDPMQFNQYVVDMVVAKQGTTSPRWEETGEPAPVATGRGLRRIRLSRRRRGAQADDYGSGDDGGRERSAERAAGAGGDQRRVSVDGDDDARASSPLFDNSGDGLDDFGDIDAETLARSLRSSDETDLPWRP
jgi:membrane protein YdbS with pleckstrin-like domain